MPSRKPRRGRPPAPRRPRRRCRRRSGTPAAGDSDTAAGAVRGHERRPDWCRRRSIRRRDSSSSGRRRIDRRSRPRPAPGRHLPAPCPRRHREAAAPRARRAAARARAPPRAAGGGVSRSASQSNWTSGFCASSARITSSSKGLASDLDIRRRAEPVQHLLPHLAAAARGLVDEREVLVAALVPDDSKEWHGEARRASTSDASVAASCARVWRRPWPWRRCGAGLRLAGRGAGFRRAALGAGFRRADARRGRRASRRAMHQREPELIAHQMVAPDFGRLHLVVLAQPARDIHHVRGHIQEEIDLAASTAAPTAPAPRDG